MKKQLIYTIAILLSLVGLFSTPIIAADTSASRAMEKEVATVGEEAFVDTNYKPGTLMHIVLFRYNESVTAKEKRVIRKRFLDLKYKSKRNGKRYIKSIVTGSQNSGEGVDQELEQAFIVTFKSAGDRNYYVGRGIVQGEGNYDKAHDDFKNFVGKYLHTPVDPSGVVVFDFKVEKK